jgi:rod shape-determining protein MreD
VSVVFLLNLFLFSFLFQSTLAPYVTISSVRPDLILLLACVGGLFYGRQRGLLLGALAGFLQDGLSGGLFGLNILTKALVGFSTGALRRHVGLHHRTLQALLVALLTAFDGLLTLVLVRFFYGGEGLVMPTVVLMVYQTLYNGLLAVPYFAVMIRVAHRYLPSGGFPYASAGPSGLRQSLKWTR